jgi:DNA primase
VAAFDLIAWLNRYVPGGRVGASGWRNSLCPFHRERSPSFGVNLETGSFKCKSASCGKKGGLAFLVKELEGITWEEAFARIDRPNPFNLDDYTEPDTTRQAPPAFNPFPSDLVPVSAQRFPTYLRTVRGYGLQDAEAFGLSFGDVASPDLSGYLVMPYWSIDGEYKTYTARRMGDGEPRYKQPTHGIAWRCLYGAWRLNAATFDRIFLVEGPFDVMRLWSLGCAAVGLSTSKVSPVQFNQLVALARQFSVPICVLLDRGEREWEIAKSVAADLRESMVSAYAVSLPDDVKDPDGLSPESLQKLLDICKRQEQSSVEVSGGSSALAWERNRNDDEEAYG